MMAAGARGPGVPAPAATAGGELHEMARAWVERTCAEQGLPIKVGDRAALVRVASVLREASDAPDRLQARGVKPVQAADSGPDDKVVQDRGDDGAALVEVEFGPLAP